MPAAADAVLAIDTSAAIPYVLRSHADHLAVRGSLAGAELRLSGHAAVETYAVLTRLPGSARLTAEDAATLLDRNFAAPVILPIRLARRMPAVLADLGVAGGATYDAIVALAALEEGLPLVTRDARAAATYRSVGVEVSILG